MSGKNSSYVCEQCGIDVDYKQNFCSERCEDLNIYERNQNKEAEDKLKEVMNDKKALKDLINDG